MKKRTILAGNLPAILSKEYLRRAVEDMYKHGLPKGLETGLNNLDKQVRLDTGRVCVITGIPNHGKSEFVDFLTTAYNRRRGMKTIYFSPENQPEARHVAKLISKLTGKPFDRKTISANELRRATDYITDNFFFCNYQKVKTSKQILDIAKEQIDKTGAKILVIDAFNKIESESPNEDTLLYISRILDELCNFAIAEDILIILVAHPRKMETMANGEYKVPTAYDINGSANFFNKSDFVLVVHRKHIKDDKDTQVLINVDKVKFSNYGKQGSVIVNYDATSGNYYSAPTDDENFNDDFSDTDEKETDLPLPFEFPAIPENTVKQQGDSKGEEKPMSIVEAAIEHIINQNK